MNDMATRPAPAMAGRWLLLTAVATLAPHTSHLPLWLSASCAALLLWRAIELQQAFTRRSRIRKLVVLLFAVAAAAGVWLEYGRLMGQHPGVALLAVLLCLKMIEGNTARDVRSAILLSFFLQLGLFFYTQSLPIAALALIGTGLATTTLLALQSPGQGAAQQLRTSALMLTQAVPLLLVLFFLFPRVPGPLWSLPDDAHSAVSGLSNTMTPGSISQLTLSGAVAFRAQFEQAPPPPRQRYWRGPVLTEFNGRTWSAGREYSAETPAYQPVGAEYRYALTLEPHNQRWLLALDYAGRANDDSLRYSHDMQVLTDTPIRSRTRFELSAYPETPVGMAERTPVLDSALELPAQSNPRTQALAEALAQDASSPQAVLENVLDHLRVMDLTYTLSPERLEGETADNFLFETQQGFCEDFAAAFVILMRGGGVPARVVTGYQGGELNPYDGSLVVRQSDAHAWAEVWLPEQGWVRIDPTALAAPARIDNGLAAALPQAERPFLLRDDMAWLRQRLEAVENAWYQRVIEYDQGSQQRLLQRLGLDTPGWQQLTSLMGAAIVLIMLCLFAWAISRRRESDPLARAWDLFCNKWAQAGYPRLPSEGPMDYADRLTLARPDRAHDIHAIAAAYARLRYAPPPHERAHAIQELTQRTKALKVR